jgi:hypothetical protein
MIGRAAEGASGLVGVGVVGAIGRWSRSSLALARKASQKLVKQDCFPNGQTPTLGPRVGVRRLLGQLLHANRARY